MRVKGRGRHGGEGEEWRAGGGREGRGCREGRGRNGGERMLVAGRGRGGGRLDHHIGPVFYRPRMVVVESCRGDILGCETETARKIAKSILQERYYRFYG